MRRATIDVPAGVPVGRIIGKGGCVAKKLCALTGVRLTSTPGWSCVELRGSDDGIAKALHLLEDLFKDIAITSAFGERCLLLSPIAFPVGCLAEFCLRDDVVTRYMWESEARMYVLVPRIADSDSQEQQSQEQQNSLASIPLEDSLDNVSLREARNLYASDGIDRAVTRMAVTAQAAAGGGGTTFDELKMRFNFGKTIFFKLKQDHQDTALSQGTLQPQKDYSVRFTNIVLPDTSERMWRHLEDRSFQQVDLKHSLSMHVADSNSLIEGEYAISFDRGDGEAPSDQLSVRKLKTTSRRLFFLGCLGHGLHSLDCRFKLMAQDHFDETTPTGVRLTALAQECSLDGASAATAAGGPKPPVSDAALKRLGFTCNSCRFKSKRVLQGSLPVSGSSVTLRVSIVDVKSSLGESATEVTGSCVQLSAALEALRCGGQRSAQHLQRVQQLMQQVVTAVTELMAVE